LPFQLFKGDNYRTGRKLRPHNHPDKPHHAKQKAVEKKFSNRRKDRNGEGLPRHQTEMSRVKIRPLVSPCNSGFISFTTEISINYNLILLLLDRSQRINVMNAVIDATITNKMNIGPNA
jgi:hypothetical protein